MIRRFPGSRKMKRYINRASFSQVRMTYPGQEGKVLTMEQGSDRNAYFFGFERAEKKR